MATPVRTTNVEELAEKTAVVKALNDALAYCDAAYDATTDTNFNAAVTTPAPGSRRSLAGRDGDTTRASRQALA